MFSLAPSEKSLKQNLDLNLKIFLLTDYSVHNVNKVAHTHEYVYTSNTNRVVLKIDKKFIQTVVEDTLSIK